MNIEHTPAGEFLPCPVFGLKRYALSVATSNHPILDVMFLAQCGQKPTRSFAETPNITCPACNGRHRRHTYDQHCSRDRTKTESEEQSRGRPLTREPRKHVNPREAINKPEQSKQPPKLQLTEKTTPIPRPAEKIPMPVVPDDASGEEEPVRASSSSGPKEKVIVRGKDMTNMEVLFLVTRNLPLIN